MIDAAHNRRHTRNREAMDLMLGTDPSQPIPSAVELLRHPWFPVDGLEDDDAVAPMPLQPGQKVAVGPPARPEPVPKGLRPEVPRMREDDGGANNGTGVRGGSAAADAAVGESSPWIETPDGSRALAAWLLKKSNEKSTLSFRQW